MKTTTTTTDTTTTSAGGNGGGGAGGGGTITNAAADNNNTNNLDNLGVDNLHNLDLERSTLPLEVIERVRYQADKLLNKLKQQRQRQQRQATNGVSTFNKIYIAIDAIDDITIDAIPIAISTAFCLSTALSTAFFFYQCTDVCTDALRV